jgi:hypothetical protein
VLAEEVIIEIQVEQGPVEIEQDRIDPIPGEMDLHPCHSATIA